MRSTVFVSGIFFLLIGLSVSADPYRNLELTTVYNTVPGGFEFGGRVGIVSDDDLDQGYMGRVSLRIGLGSKVELQALLPYYTLEPEVGDPVKGIGKVDAGFKVSPFRAGPVDLGFMLGALLPTAEEELLGYEGGANGVDYYGKGLLNIPFVYGSALLFNGGYIVTGEGDTAFGTEVDPEDIVTYGFAFNQWVLAKQLMFILEYRAVNQDDISRKYIMPGVRYEPSPGFVLELFGSISIGDEDEAFYDLVLYFGFTREFR